MGDKDYQQGYKDGQSSAKGETSLLEEMGNSIASPFTAVTNPDYSSGRSEGFNDTINKK